MTVSQADALKRLGALFEMPEPRVEKCKALYQLAQETKGGCIVELGAATGTGAIALAYGAPDGVTVYAIDDYKERTGWANEWYGPENAVIFRDNIDHAGVTVHLVRADVRMAARRWCQPVALVHWDLGMFSGMEEDFWLWERHVIAGGVIAVHDTFSRQLGSHDVEEQARLSGKFHPPQQLGGGVWAFQKR